MTSSAAQTEAVFADVPHHARGHLGLLFYAAAFHLVHHLRSRTAATGADLDQVFHDHPFLAEFFEPIRQRLPEEMTWLDSLAWLRANIEAWEQESPTPLPLLEMRIRLALPFESTLAFILAGMVEEEAHFAALFAEIQQPQGERRATAGLVQSVLGGAPDADSWQFVGRLIDNGFLEVSNRDDPRSQWLLRVPHVLWNAVRGECPEEPAPCIRWHPQHSLEPVSDLILAASVRAQLAELQGLAGSAPDVATIVLRGMPGSDRLGAIGAVAHGRGSGLLEVQCPTAQLSERCRAWIGPLATLLDAMPVYAADPGPSETFEIPALGGYHGPCAVLLGYEGGVSGAQPAITVALPLECQQDRLELWTRALAGKADYDVLRAISGLCLPGRYIRECAPLAAHYAAMEGRSDIALADVQQAARTLNRQVLDTLAVRIDGPARFSQLVVRDATLRELRMLESRCRHRERLASSFEGNIPGGMNRGVRALFEGPSGTGKTLAARVLATALGLDLYRVDLAAVMNKYIGETEKNLSRVLSRAEDLNVILLLDEGDALMSQRTDVKSSNDRYANLETDYLLQRLETYTGIVFVTTNASHSVDSAFRRRMDSLVKFHLPDAEERWRLWIEHLPPGHSVSSAVL
jgi:hypothetical protein